MIMLKDTAATAKVRPWALLKFVTSQTAFVNVLAWVMPCSLARRIKPASGYLLVSIEGLMRKGGTYN